jgi:hypothetical protein
MSVKENKEIVRRVIDIWNQRDFNSCYKLLAPEEESV